MSVLTPDINDFIGEINLDLKHPNIQDAFEQIGTVHQKDILRDLLDDKLYNALIADLDGSGNPQTPPYIALVNGETYTKPSGKTVIYEGLIRMLNYFVYSFYLDKTWSSNVSTGQITNLNENSIKVNRAELRKVRAEIHNKAVKLYNAAIKYLDDEKETYFPSGTNDYSFWNPKVKKFIGKIIMGTPSNSYFYNRSSKGN